VINIKRNVKVPRKGKQSISMGGRGGGQRINQLKRGKNKKGKKKRKR